MTGKVRVPGHVATIASLEGKKGIPFDAAYSGTKVALINWMEGLHLELEGTGVKTSVILPGHVSEAGIFADRGATAPRLMGASAGRHHRCRFYDCAAGTALCVERIARDRLTAGQSRGMVEDNPRSKRGR